jgi:hypothetical protein
VSSEPISRKSIPPQFAQWAVAVGLFCLSLAVFNWGLQYKMSLYENINGIVHAPAAKLWTGKIGGSAQSAQIPLAEPAPLPIQVTFLIAIFALYCVLRDASAVRTLLHWRSHGNFLEINRTPFREAFFFRPPPVNA